ncbi:MAG: YicC family protein [Paramuribaculum sp.]|nr:YicC family protein [Paramuribaculum sp.]
MLLSMTGFGKGVVEHENHKIVIEVKSLNSKQLDMSVKLPSMFRDIELELRNHIARRLERGKVEVAVAVERIATADSVVLNLPVLESYKRQIEEMSRRLQLPLPQDWYSTLLRLPDALTVESDTASESDEGIREALFEAADEAVEQLMQFRAKEGNKLEEFFAVRISEIERMLGEVAIYEGERVEKIRARITDNLEQIAPGSYDTSRLEQEMIFYIEKLDVNEEKQRLGQHLRYFTETMEGSYGQGKKLGFIAQEMGREINTLGSKSNHAAMQRLVVRMKDELEQIKEQVLNVL